MALATTLILIGCGGGSSSSPTPTPSPTPSTSGPVQVVNGVLTITTSSLQVSFQGAIISSMKNLLTGETYIKAPGPGLLDLNLQEPTGELLKPGTWVTQSDGSGGTIAVLVLTDSQRTATMTAGVDTVSGEVFVRWQGVSKKPGVRGLLWGIQGFDPVGRFILPAHAGLYFDSNSQPPSFSFAYPTHWEAQFAIYESASGCALLYARDSRPYFKLLQGTRELGTLDLAVETYALGPFSTATQVPVLEWRLAAFQGSWKNAVDTYSSWSKTAFPPRPADSRRDWTKKINVVVTVIDPDTAFLDTIASELDPAKTLVYFVNWRKDGFDANYPDYTPGSQAAAFIEYAHRLGFHVMLHANALGVATYNPVYTSMASFQIRDPETSALVFWPWGLWPAGPPPPAYLQSYSFISPASSAYRALAVQNLTSVVQAVRADAIHLDAGGVLLNDGNGLVENMTSIDGMIQLHRDISSALPQLALGYESMTESLAGFYSFAQRWNAEYPAHPVSTYLMGGIRFYGFLDQPNPDEPGFLDYIKRYEAQGIMPTITVAHPEDLSTSLPVTARVLQMMKLWQQYDFRPDWSGDWKGLLFRYIGADGSTMATAQSEGGITTLKTSGSTVYKRAHGVSSVATSAFIPDWPAYDSSNLYGLDPSAEYWLVDDAARPTTSLHLSDLPNGVKIGQGTVAAGDYGYFELARVPQPSFDFIGQFVNAKVGVAGANGDFHLQSGALAQVTQTIVEGKNRSPVIVMQPPFGGMLGGATFAEYNVAVPAAATLNFTVGISDLGTRSDGAIFKVTVNGAQVWRSVVQLGKWTPIQVDLSPYAGQTVKLRFLIHPGNSLNPVDDICAWGDLSITSTPATDTVSFSVVAPNATAALSGTTQVTLTPTADTTKFGAKAILPAYFALFVKPAPVVAVGQSLLGLPATIWKKGYGGYAFQKSVGDSGKVGSYTSLTATKDPAIAVEPPDRGYSLATWAVHIPSNASQLTFSVALADPPVPATIPYSGVGFSLLINGQSLFEQTLQSAGWVDASVDLTPYRGQQVVITLQCDANGSGIFDWSRWAGLTIQ